MSVMDHIKVIVSDDKITVRNERIGKEVVAAIDVQLDVLKHTLVSEFCPEVDHAMQQVIKSLVTGVSS